MRPNHVSLEFYLKLSVAALAIVAGCATAQSPAVAAADSQAAPGITTVYLVRHGEKVTRRPDDPDPDISADGKRRAKALATRLGKEGVTAIIATQFKRTQETAEPLASAMGLTAEIVPAGDNFHADAVAAAVMRHRGGKILVVGHSLTIGPIIAALGGPYVPNLCDTEYSNLYVMYIPPSGQPELKRQHYGMHDTTPDLACQ
jgi:phosphohistidine phosphatase SixA